MASAEQCKLLGNEAVASKNWEAAHKHYLKGLEQLLPSEGSLKVILKSNISLVLFQLSRFQEALDEASKCIDLDPKFEKGYLRYAAALEALNLKLAAPALNDSCPVMKAYRRGLEMNPGSTLITDAMKISFPSINTSAALRSSKNSVKTKSSKTNKKQLSGSARAEREACVSLDIRGSTGQHELRVNGRYDPTDELSGGWPIYRKRIEIIPGENDEVDEDDNLILEFHSGLDEWMVKHVSSKGSHRSFVFLKCSPPTRPELCRSSSWQSMEEKKIINQVSMSVLTIDQRHEEDVAFFKRERDSCMTIEVRGTVGRKAPGINGIFEPTEDFCGGWPVYRKISDGNTDADAIIRSKLEAAKDEINAIHSTPLVTSSPSSSSSSSSPQNLSVWMEYNPYFRSWQVKPTPCLGTNRSWGYSNTNTMHGTLPQLSRGVWEVLEDEDFRSQEAICLMTLTQWQIEDEKLAQIWSASCSIDVRGATGTYGPVVNGVYDPLSTFVAGYQKRTDPKCVIEYSRMRKLWQLKCTQGPCAFVPDDSRSLPEHCSAVWYVMVNGNWERQATVKVSSLSSRKALDNEMYGDKLPDALPLDVRGATGVNAFKINGVYEPIDEFSGGWPVYQRKGGVDYWLEYNEERGNWQIKSASHRGMDSAFAYVDSFPSQYPQRCGGTWWVYTGVRGANSNSGWEMQQSVTILSVADRTVEDMKSHEKRKMHCVPLDIRGATGPRGGGLNGVFDPTDEMRGGWPVYLKRDDGEWWLEYDACPQKWMIRPTACRGTTRGRAYILCDPNTRPERAKGVWRLSDGKGGWAPEPTVQVVSETEAIAQDKVLFDARRAVASDIAIRGAVKPVGHINGIYEPTEESSHAWPIYKKKGCETHYLEYHAPSSSWQVKPATVRGTKRCWAYVHSESEHPELSSKAWLVITNGEHAKQESIVISTLQEQAQNDKTLGNIRRKTCSSIKIRGATGMHASVINGIYEPSPSELCGGWPVYYNNCASKTSEAMKNGNGKSASIAAGTATGAGVVADAGAGVGAGDGAPDITKSFLLFCPYAMSWAITVLANFNDPSIPVIDPTIPSITSSTTAPATATTATSIATTAAAINSNDNKSKKNTDTDDKTQKAKSVSPDILSLPQNTQILNTEKDLKSLNVLPYYTPSSAPLTLAFFEVSSNIQPELAHSTATWKVLSGALFEPQTTIKVSVVSDTTNSSSSSSSSSSSGNGNSGSNGTKNSITPQKAVTKQKTSTVTPVKGKEMNGNGKNNNGNTSTSNFLASNFSQIGVKNTSQDQKKNGKDVIDAVKSSSLSPNRSRDSLSPARTATVPSTATAAATATATATATSTTTSTSLSTSTSQKAVIKDTKKNSTWQNRGITLPAEPAPMSAIKRTVSNGTKTISKKNAVDNNSDDGVGVSNSEIEDEWLEVRQKRAKGPSNGSSSSGSRGGPQATSSSTATSSVKDTGSRSPSPLRPNGNGSGTDALSSATFSTIGSDGNIDYPPVSVTGPVPSSTGPTPSFQSPPATSMGFKAAVLSRQQETVTSTSPVSYLSSSQAQSNVQTVPQSFSVLDFPAMPTSSLSQKAANVQSPPPVAPLPSTPSVQLEVPIIPAVVLAPPTEALIAAANPTKKSLKAKKKPAKAEADPTPDMSKLHITPDVRVNSVRDNSVSVETYASPSDKLPTEHNDVATMVISDSQESSDNALDTSAYSDVPSTYQMPSVTVSGPHGAIEGYATDLGPCTSGSTHHVPNAIQINGQSNTRPPVNNNNDNNNNHAHEYAYQNHPHADEENDDDLFKAISSANAIDFDPSFTANNLPRSACSTLSPLSRRVGARNDISLTHDTLPRPVSAVNMHQIAYSSSLLDPPGRASPAHSQPSTEDFLCGISFDFFSSLLDSNAHDIAPCRMTRREGSLHDLAHSTATSAPILPLPHTKYPLLSSSIEGMQVNEYAPHCNDYQYRGPGIPDLNDDNYTESDSHSVRYQMPTLIPIPPLELVPLPLPPFSSADMIASSSMTTTHYNKMGILDLPQGIPVSTPQLLTARELCLATDNFSANHLMDTSEISYTNNLHYHSSRFHSLNEEEKRREKEKETSICTFTGILRHNLVVIKIVTPSTDSKINTDLQSQYLRELRVLSEVTHPHILPLYGYTFRPYARVFLIPPRSAMVGGYTSDSNGSKRSSCRFIYLYSALCNIERRKRMSWKMRIRIVMCILMALSHLHAGDVEAGRCPIAHSNIHVGNIVLENLEGDAYLTDFSHSTDLPPLAHTCSPEDGNDDKIDDAEVDVQSTGVILLQLLTGQSAENHSDVITARALFKMDHSKSNASHSSGNRKVRHRNGIPCTLDSRQLDDLVRLAEIDIWPILVIHRVAEALSTFFTIDIMDPGVELIRRKCNLLLLMLSRISTM